MVSVSRLPSPPHLGQGTCSQSSALKSGDKPYKKDFNVEKFNYSIIKFSKDLAAVKSGQIFKPFCR